MTAAAEITSHVHLDERGVAWVDDTNTKVTEIVMDWLAHGWSPAEIHYQHRHLSLAQIHAAFAYYFDHQTQLDAEIARGKAFAESLRNELGESPAVKRLRAAGHLK